MLRSLGKLRGTSSLGAIGDLKLCAVSGRQLSTHHEAASASKLQSTLYVATRDRQTIDSATRPTFDLPYLQHVAHNLKSIQESMKRRGLDAAIEVDEMKSALIQFGELTRKLEKLKVKRNKLKGKIQHNTNESMSEKLDLINQQLGQEIRDARPLLNELEDQVVPFLLSIPSDIRQDVPSNPQPMDQFEGSANEHLSRGPPVSHVRLGYLHNTFHSSIVGPDAHFLLGDGALVFHALTDYLSDLFEEAQFTPFNGLDLVKSALVEAVHGEDVHQDGRLLTAGDHEHEDNQRTHLVGDSSLESFCAWLCKQPKQLTGKYYQVGSSYDDPLRQIYCVRATILALDTESDEEMQHLYGLWWRALTQLGIKCRSLRSDVTSLLPSEHAKFELLVWLHSKQEWLPAGYVSHHYDYLSRRLGNNSSKHVISSSVDLLQLFKCLLEHYQDPSTGKVWHAPCLSNYL